jgi:hypothetical protein
VNNNGVLSVASGSANVTIGGTSQNPTISVTESGGEVGYTYINFDGGSQSGTLPLSYATVGATDITKRYLVFYSVIGSTGNPDLQIVLNPYFNQASHFTIMNSSPVGGNNITIFVEFPQGIPFNGILPTQQAQYQLNPCSSLDISYSNATGGNIQINPFRTVPNI